MRDISAISNPSTTLSLREAFLSRIEWIDFEKESMSVCFSEWKGLQRILSKRRLFKSLVIPGFSEICKDSKLRARLKDIPMILMHN